MKLLHYKRTDIFHSVIFFRASVIRSCQNFASSPFLTGSQITTTCKKCITILENLHNKKKTWSLIDFC